jgi:hypothetical protein
MSMNKSMEKKDWLYISNDLLRLNINEEEIIGSIILKIAKELDIETNSVKISDLKEEIITKIEVIKQRGESADETNDENFADVILQEIDEPVTEDSIVKEPIIEEPIVEETIVEEPVVKEEPKVVYSELDNLRAECITYGVAYTEKHKVSDLTQLLGQIRGRVTATMTIEEALKQLNPAPSNEPAPTMDANNFELTLDNADVVKEIAPAQTNTSVSVKLETKKIAVPVATVKSNLEVYRGTFTQTIRGHFRPQTIQEINALFNHEYPFTHEVKVNPKNELQVEIIFSMHGVDVRVPSDDNNDWIQIR